MSASAATSEVPRARARPASRWLRCAESSVAVAFVVAVFFAAQNARKLSDAGWIFLVALTYATSIAFPATWLLPRIARALRGRLALTQWLAMLGALLALTAAGCFATIELWVLFGLFSQATVWTAWLHAVTVGAVIALVIGVVSALYERIRARLEQAELELRTQELAHARALERAAQARLDALAARIHPHFLFNALNSIAALIRDEPATAERMVERLSTLLRFSLDADPTGLVPLERELRVVRDYVALEQARYGERLRFRLDVPRGLEQVPVPPLSIQSLVENGVKHAVATRRVGAAITVGARPADGGLRIEVTDDGPGFGASELPKGHGLENLRARLEARFGAKGRLEISTPSDPAASAGAVVALVVPMSSEREAA